MNERVHMDDAPATIDLDAIGVRLAQLPTAQLLAQLDAILAAIDSSIPERQRRRSGFFGRLLARDLVAQAQPDDVDTRVHLHLGTAHDLAQRLSDETASLEALAPWLREQAQALRLRANDASNPDDPQRRAGIAATWDTTAAHVDLVRAHSTQLLRRHAQMRDVLVPAWRQQKMLSASKPGGERDALEQNLRAQILAFRGSAPSPAVSTDIRHDPALAHRDAQPQEPSP